MAGSCLAWHLLRLGQSVAVIDRSDPFSASRVAAGTVNPMTFRRVLKSWNADTLLATAKAFYRSIPGCDSDSFINDILLYKVFATAEEPELWHERIESGTGAPYLEIPSAGAYADQRLSQPHGGGLVRGAFWLNTQAFLAYTRQHLTELGAFYDGSVNAGQIDFGTSVGVIVGEQLIEGKHVIYCDGAYGNSSHFFGWLPFKPVKGEVLTIEAPELQLDMIAHRQCFVLPLGNHRYRVGSTYEWEELNCEPTEAGRSLITERLERLITVPYTVIDHVAGVRPTIRDRRPFLGQHPAIERLWILNGLGTKGVLQAPWAAELLAQNLVNDTALPKEVDIARHYSYFEDVLEAHGQPIEN